MTWILKLFAARKMVYVFTPWRPAHGPY